MTQTVQLEILGMDGKQIPNTFLQQEQDTRHLALILPGIRYTGHMPVLYYPRMLLAQRWVDVLNLDADYSHLDLKSRSRDQALEPVYQDAAAALRVGMAQRDYVRVTLIGKSLGTWSMGRLVVEGQHLPNRVDCVWLTPMLNNPAWRELVVCGKRLNLIVTGTADPYYRAAALNEIEHSIGCYKMVVDGADHLLEIPGNATESLKVLQRLIKILDAFLWEEHRSKWAWI